MCAVLHNNFVGYRPSTWKHLPNRDNYFTSTWKSIIRTKVYRPMFSLRRFLVLVAGIASCVNAKSSTGNSVLVVVEPKHQDDFSIFFDGLKGECCRIS